MRERINIQPDQIFQENHCYAAGNKVHEFFGYFRATDYDEPHLNDTWGLSQFTSVSAA